MNEKKLKLIEEGMKLFANKGYHTTAIQEIATAAGVSKGAFYLYFQSKEDFVATAFQFYHQQITERLEKVRQKDLPPKENLAKQIAVLITYIYSYKDFIMMYLHENIAIGKNADKLFKQMKIQNFRWLEQNIRKIYGEEVDPYIIDIVIQLDGLINGYFKWIVMDHVQLEPEKIGPFLTRRIDDIVEGMINRNEEALITLDKIPHEYDDGRDEQVNKTLDSIKFKIKTLDSKKKDQLFEAVDVIHNETKKIEPQFILIQGMLAHFQRVPELQDECREIARLLDIELLN